jgi:Family of unknown function (DUF5670)
LSEAADPSSSITTATQSAHLSTHCARNRKETPMLETIAIILVVLWLLGMVSSYTLGGFIHILLVIAVIIVIIRIIRGRNPL